MTHRLDLERSSERTRILFHGDLDGPALVELAALCVAESRNGGPVHVLLSAGTRVESPALLDRLAQQEGITLEAEAAYLQRWIQTCEVTA